VRSVPRACGIAYLGAVPGTAQICQLEYLVALAHERHFGRADRSVAEVLADPH